MIDLNYFVSNKYHQKIIKAQTIQTYSDFIARKLREKLVELFSIAKFTSVTIKILDQHQLQAWKKGILIIFTFTLLAFKWVGVCDHELRFYS